MSTSTFPKTETPFVFRNTAALTTLDTLIEGRNGQQMRIQRIIVQGSEIPVSSNDSIRIQAFDGTNAFDVCTPIFNTSGVAERSERRRDIKTDIVVPERGAAGTPNDLRVVLSTAFGAEFSLTVLGQWEDAIPNNLASQFARADLVTLIARQTLYTNPTNQGLVITRIGYDGVAVAANADLRLEHGDGAVFENIMHLSSSVIGEATPLPTEINCKIEIPAGNDIFYTSDSGFQNQSSLFVAGYPVNDVRTIDPAGTP